MYIMYIHISSCFCQDKAVSRRTLIYLPKVHFNFLQEFISVRSGVTKQLFCYCILVDAAIYLAKSQHHWSYSAHFMDNPYPAGISGSVVVLWSYFPTPLPTYMFVNGLVNYMLLPLWLNQTATKTTDLTRSLIVPLSTSWLVSSHSPSKYHVLWVGITLCAAADNECGFLWNFTKTYSCGTHEIIIAVWFSFQTRL